MKRILTASLALAAFTPAVALARPVTRLHVRQYERAYGHVVHVFGRRAAGRNIVRDGLSHGKLTDAVVATSINVLHRMFMPIPRPPVYGPGPTVIAPAVSYTQAPAYATGGACGGNTPYPGGGQCWAIPYSVVSCESGGQNVPNSSGSGANGYYQLMVGGTGSRAEQDAAAHAMWANGAGASNWTCAG